LHTDGPPARPGDQEKGSTEMVFIRKVRENALQSKPARPAEKPRRPAAKPRKLEVNYAEIYDRAQSHADIERAEAWFRTLTKMYNDMRERGDERAASLVAKIVRAEKRVKDLKRVHVLMYGAK
jgi:hypothetical protein